MIAHGQATHDCLNLELRHHQYAERILIILIQLHVFTLQMYIISKITTKHLIKKKLSPPQKTIKSRQACPRG